MRSRVTTEIQKVVSAGAHKASIITLSAAALCLVATGASGGNATDAAKINPAQFKPEALYIDLANPANARGISLADTNEAANLKQKELAGMLGAEPTNGYVTVKLDPAVVKTNTPLLVAFNYYDSGWEGPMIQGFLPQPSGKGYYTSTLTGSGAYSESWRWWTTFTYANYNSGFPPNANQSSFRLKVKGIRWILVLPLNEAATTQMNGIREKVLGMLVDYGRLLTVEAALQENRNRLEQGLKYLPANSQAAESVAKVFNEVENGARAARTEMDQAIMNVLTVIDPVYLGLFDGQEDGRVKALEEFRQKAAQLAQHYRKLSTQAEGCMAEQVNAQCAQYGMKKMALTAPEKLGAERIVKPEDVRSRFFMGLVHQAPLLILPQSSLDSITEDQGIDSVCEYSLSNWVKPREDSSYDFTDLDELLGAPRGLRVELGMHNIPLLSGWAEKKFFGDKPEILPSGSKYYDYYRVKGSDGRWDGFCIWDPNGPRSFTPSVFCVWSETLFRYACDFYRAVGKHYRDNPMILRYNLNSEQSAAQVAELGKIWDAARPYYRDHLKKKFDDIKKLNRVFGANYKNFDEIPLPKPAEGAKMARLTPAYYEYTQLCIERTKYVREEFARILKKADANHMVGECQSSMFGGNTMDTYAMAVNTPFDTFAAGDSDIRSVRYQYSLNRYHPRPIWMYEPYSYWPFTAPEGKGCLVEEATKRILTANVWRWFIWGHQGLPFFNQRAGSLGTDITDYRIADIMLWPSECNWHPAPVNPVVRSAAGSLAALKPVYEKLESVLWSAPVVAPRIGLFESATTHRVPWPTSGTFDDVGQLQGRLTHEEKHFFFIPETALVEGAEPMDSYRVIIAAYATHLRPEARDALLKWVKKGGVLIGSGPTGLFDHYGRTEGGLPETVFGMKGVEYGAGLTGDNKVAKCNGTMAGREGISLWSNKDFYWRLPSTNLAEGTRVLAALADGTPVVAERNYGEGKVILTATTIGSLPDLYWPMVMTEINNAQPVPEAVSSASGLNLQVRESAKGIRYLSVVNVNVKAPVEATITVAGEFEHPRDITMGNGWVIPATAGGGVTRFKIWMGPGMGSFIELGRSKTKLTGLSPEEENARLAIGRYANLLRRSTAWGLKTSAEEKALSEVEKEREAQRYTEARSRLAEMTPALSARWFEARAEKIEDRARAKDINPTAAAWAQSYAAIARQLLKEGKLELAEERMDRADKTLSETPAVYLAEATFPFVSGRLDLKDLSSWPKEGWQTVYKNRKAKTGELGQFILVGAADGIYVGAKVLSTNVIDKAQKSGLAWRVMDGVVVNLRYLDVTRELSSEWQSEDSYEITFYADGSVFVWDNLLPCDAKQIRNVVTRVKDGYWVGGFIPSSEILFWPRPGLNVITDVCLFTYSQKDNTDGYWHGFYGQANTWARARLGGNAEDRGQTTDDRPETKAEEQGRVTQLPPNTAEACLRVEHWMPQDAREVGRAAVAFDADEALPSGKKGAIMLSNPSETQSVQLMTRFDALGQKPGLRVWLKGNSTGADIELRVTGREGYTWQMILKDDVAGWRTVDVVLDQCRQVYEENHSEVMGGFFKYRPLLNQLIVRFTKPLTSVKVGLVEYLPQ